jgi:hypothetical protein
MPENHRENPGKVAGARDNLFDTAAPAVRFEFNEQVAAVFDDMLNRSIPFYREVISLTAGILARTLAPGDTVYDLGCSTGTTLLHLAALDREGDFLNRRRQRSPSPTGFPLSRRISPQPI